MKTLGVREKKAFTMIELIFVIVILGILASVALPRLAATRDDARAVGVKSDIGTILNAVPAWYMSQQEASIINALSLNTAVWIQQGNNIDYLWLDSGDQPCIQIRIVDANATAILDATIPEPSGPGAFVNGGSRAGPTLQVIDVRGGATVDSLCDLLWDPSRLYIQEVNISIAGNVLQR